jgi:primase-polymerase (primpol)-like protein
VDFESKQGGRMTKFLDPRFDQIPPDLQNEMKWAVWQAEPRPKQPGKFNKAPRSPINGQPISVNQPDSFSDFATCKRTYEKGGYTGIGILLEGNGWVGVDIDNFARIPSKGREAALAWIVDALLRGAYVERSPSGAGLRAIFRGEFLGKGRKVGPFEIYREKRFLTITGHAITNVAGVPSDD